MTDQMSDYWRLELLGVNDRTRRQYRRRAMIRACLWMLIALALVVVAGRVTATNPVFLIAEGVAFILVWHATRSFDRARRHDPLPPPS
jgi:hypothetical protein